MAFRLSFSDEITKLTGSFRLPVAKLTQEEPVLAGMEGDYEFFE
jgi:hypothetical protein